MGTLYSVLYKRKERKRERHRGGHYKKEKKKDRKKADNKVKIFYDNLNCIRYKWTAKISLSKRGNKHFNFLKDFKKVSTEKRTDIVVYM